MKNYPNAKILQSKKIMINSVLRTEMVTTRICADGITCQDRLRGLTNFICMNDPSDCNGTYLRRLAAVYESSVIRSQQ